MEIIVNGETTSVPGDASVADIVQATRASTGAPSGGGGTAVALDDAVVPAGAWATTTVAPGARVEVLRAVAGG